MFERPTDVIDDTIASVTNAIDETEVSMIFCGCIICE